MTNPWAFILPNNGRAPAARPSSSADRAGSLRNEVVQDQAIGEVPRLKSLSEYPNRKSFPDAGRQENEAIDSTLMASSPREMEPGEKTNLRITFNS